MTVYFIFYVIIVVFGLFVEDRRKGLYLAISFLLLFALIALRHPSMGFDLQYGSEEGYLGAYKYFASCSWREILAREKFDNYDFGFVILNKILSYISSNPQTLLIATSFLTLAPVFYVIEKDSDESFLSIIIYLGLPSFLMVFSALRQTIAIGLLFLAIHYIKEKKFVKQLILILIAASIHKTALVFLIAYPVYHIKLSNVWRLYSLCFLLILFCYSRSIIPLFLWVGNNYIENHFTVDNNSSNNLFVIYVLIYTFCCSLDDGENNGYLNLFFIACCMMAFEHLHSFISRLAMYYEMSLVLLLPSMFCYKKKWESDQFPGSLFKNKIFYILFRITMFICFTGAGLYFIYSTYWSMSYPYHFLWETI